jgi:hypothetical protein
LIGRDGTWKTMEPPDIQAIELPDLAPERLPDGRVLTGHVAEWADLLGALDERLGLVVVSADPGSGTSAILDAAVSEVSGGIQVDARRCSGVTDLAMLIADQAVAAYVPEAASWWLGAGQPSGPPGIKLARVLNQNGIPFNRIRDGRGDDTTLLTLAVDVAAALAMSNGTLPRLAIDHLGVLLATLRAPQSRSILSSLRTAKQRHSRLQLLLVDHPGGPITAAVADARHPMYRAAEILRITRPTPERFVADLAITRPLVSGPSDLLGAAAELADGVPSLIWRIVDLAPAAEDQPARAFGGWQRLQQITAPAVAQQWELLRRVHSTANELITAMSLGLAPHSIRAADKSITDGLNRLRDLGLAWQPAPRRWAVSDPLLAAFARTHTPAWASRRSAQPRRSVHFG